MGGGADRSRVNNLGAVGRDRHRAAMSSNRRWKVDDKPWCCVNVVPATRRRCRVRPRVTRRRDGGGETTTTEMAASSPVVAAGSRRHARLVRAVAVTVISCHRSLGSRLRPLVARQDARTGTVTDTVYPRRCDLGNRPVFWALVVNLPHRLTGIRFSNRDTGVWSPHKRDGSAGTNTRVSARKADPSQTVLQKLDRGPENRPVPTVAPSRVNGIGHGARTRVPACPMCVV